jgi:transcriptional antiterminator NusG
MSDEAKTLAEDTQEAEVVEEEGQGAEEQAAPPEPLPAEAPAAERLEEEATDVLEEQAEAELVKQVEPELAEQETEPEEAGEAVAEHEEEPAQQEGRYWYVIHSYSGYENKVKKNLDSRIESMGMLDYIFEVVVPTEDVVELRDGRRRTVEQRIFPGYILVDMILNDESWFVVRNTPGVTGFVGSANEPTPLRQEEADSILRRMEEEAPKVKVSFRIGDVVRIVDGPFSDFMGTVDDLNLEKGKVRLLVSFFGRETPVELDFLQVETE